MPNKCHQLFTAGYAGHDPNSFLATLREHGIERIIDVRQNPTSRKPGFSRAKLAEFLRQNGIEYRHFRDLGVPRELRNQLSDHKCTLDEYFQSFRKYLETQRPALAALFELKANSRCCLICLERDPAECHRTVVADAIASHHPHDIQIVHI